MPDGLAEKTDRMAAQLGVSRSELIQRALEQFVEDASDDAITRQLDRIYGRAASALESAVATTQRAVLLDEGW